MYTEFIKKLSLRLINNEFSFVGISGDGHYISEKTDIAIMGKSIGGIFYLVNIVDGDKVPMDTYIQKSDGVIKQIYENLSHYICTRLICVNIITGQVSKDVIDKQESYVADDITKVWWWVDLQAKEIYVPKGQPDKLHSIEKCIEETFGDERDFSQTPIEIGKYEQAVRQHTALERRTTNSGLTTALVAINVAIFVLETLTGTSNILVDKFSINPTAILQQHEYYRLFSSMFLHADLMHLLSNCLYLYLFGGRVEKYYGKMNFVYIYLISGICGGILSTALTRSIAIGASGAIYGLLGATLVLSQLKQKSIDGLSLHTILIIVFPGLLLGMFSPYIDVWGHVGGLIGGYIVGFVMNKLVLSK